jgi:hypothetical protein
MATECVALCTEELLSASCSLLILTVHSVHERRHWYIYNVPYRTRSYGGFWPVMIT